MSKGRKLLVCLSLMMVVLLFFTSGFALASGKPPLEKARENLEQKLVGVPGFAGIAHSEEEGAIIVFLEHEGAKGKVPDRHEGFPVRAEVTGRFKTIATQVTEAIAPSQANQVSTERLGVVRPLLGGISLSAYIAGKSYAGTLGMITYSTTTGIPQYILSNAHVIAMDPATAKFLALGTPTIQPGSYDGGTLANKVGVLEKYIPISFLSTRKPNYADAAIATLQVEGLSGYQFDEAHKEGKYQVSGTTTVAAGDIVRKSGRTTGVRTGEVYVTNASVRVYYTLTKWAYFADQIVVYQPFIQAGDSGSCVDKGGQFVGLAFAASSSYAIVCKAAYIIQRLGVSVQ